MDAVILGSSPNALSVARSLGRAGLEVVLATSATRQSVRHSRYVKRFAHLRDIDPESLMRCLTGLPGQGTKPFLIGTGDRTALFIAEHQDRLKNKYCFVTPSYAILDAIIDKAKLYETAKRNGFRHPRFHVVENADDIEEAIARIPTPCYVKPAVAHRWRRLKRTKLERAETKDQLRRVLQFFVAHGLAAVPQEIIPGGDDQVISLSTYIDRSGDPVGFRTKRKIRQYPLQAGNGTLQEIYDQPQVADLGMRLLSVTGHRGPATVEFRRDPRDGEFVLIEINARTILAQDMITRSGLDVPLIAYCDATRRPMPPVAPPRPTRWIYFAFDVSAFRDLRGKGELTTIRWLSSISKCNAFAFWALDDPVPFLISSFFWLEQIIKNRVRRGAAILARLAGRDQIE